MLMEIRWQGLRDILRYDRAGSLKRFIEDIFRRRALTSFLLSDPLFAGISDSQLEKIIPHCQLQTFGDYDSAQPFKEMAKEGSDQNANEPVIAEEGDYPNGVILIRSGLARISRIHHNGRRTIGYLNPGRAFGFEEIVRGWTTGTPSRYDSRLSAIGYLNAVVVPTYLIEGLLEKGEIRIPDSGSRNDDFQSDSLTGVDENLLDFLVDRHYVQGTATMVIDLNRCTRCDDCVRACAATHDGNPRFIRHGPTSGRHMIANACLHCLDPVCMIECPTAAIHRDRTHGLVVINEQTCIGCAQCAGNCPFDAIRMVELRNPHGDLIVDAKNTPLLEATKCDLCVDQLSGPIASGRCLLCHTTDRDSNDGRLRINWQASLPASDGRPFTRFSHAPHILSKGSESCETCHQFAIDHSTNTDTFRREFFARDASGQWRPVTNADSTCTSGFRPVARSNCVQCHTSNRVSQSCVECHNYHVSDSMHGGIQVLGER